ncbi:alpha/beta hydrolase [Amycolatopsis acidiphila]|uniref:Alpha/beta hydrolase n=1 Tax=Amycolatopsis acidiphila TaxID=715473 RepID=A0A558AIJ2_9PSEU|nr:alpha/beta hydrolase [Amycolatopsis acidiphila]TVT24011.1 alpha/beta hydrolase [Amycolatopsis acidiphila]UIJ57843.1 alpha/beta hydrolase [Amycolatopsis acidiphila]GHG88044.1 alpha/beta hydrolase [Amycolatopsis acidiphila]
MSTTFTFTGSDGLEITAYRWDPAATPTGVVQITHGVGEHALRYTETAERFTAAGLVVYAQDHRGHGATADATQYGMIGADGWAALVADIGVLSTHARLEHPELPLTLLAHSLGSFAAQQYLIEHSADVDAVILTGTAAVDLLAPALDLDSPVGLEMFNAPFQPARTEFDWLTRDESIVDAYLADSRCGFNLDPGGLKAMFDEAARAGEATDRVRTDLPLYIAVGELDPVNGNLALLRALEQRYLAAGLTDLTMVTYPGARHELLNETNRTQVVIAMIDWMRERHLITT